MIPIIFRADILKAILEGWKTQFRKVLKRQSTTNETPYLRPDGLYIHTSNDGIGVGLPFKCPFGKVGDKLCVKETWATNKGVPKSIFYKTNECIDFPDSKGWRSPVTMPQWASRITIEITDVRVERVQEITFEDCVDEGIIPPHRKGMFAEDETYEITGQMFEDLWNSIHGKDAWKRNPFVWVLAFKRI